MKLSYWLAIALASAVGCGSDDNVTGPAGLGGGGSSSGAGKWDAGKKDGGKRDAGSSADDDDPYACDKLRLPSRAASPQILIVLDRSGSMVGLGDPRNAGKNRWLPSVSAVKTLTASLTQTVEFGLMVFPAAGVGGVNIPGIGTFGGGAGACAPGVVDVPVGLDTADEISSVLDRSTPNTGATPTAASLAAAKDALDTGICGDCAPVPKYVLLVTDGQPTCGDGGGTMTTDADIQAANTAIDELSAAQIKTYVIGYDTASDPAAAAIMDGFAQHGGTDKYFPVEDEQSLVAELTRIAGALVPCEFELSGEVDDPSYVRVEIDGKSYNYGTDWTVEGTTITLDPNGAACPRLRDAQVHDLNITRECNVVQVI